MLVFHENPVTDAYFIPLADNVTFLTESTLSSWPVTSTLSSNSLPLVNVTSSWGPKRDPLYIVVPITVIYAVILLTGLVGNVSTCIVIARNKHMHTATNYYLFSLAVSDLLLLVSGLPQEMYYNWSRYPYIFGEAFCVLQGFAAETSANATVLTITAFTVERYVAICHPFQSHTLSKLSRAVRLVLVIWLLAMGLAVPQALQFGVVHEELPDGRKLDDEHSACVVKRVVIPHSFEVSTLVFFVAPMTLISVLYALIGLQLRRSSLRGGGGSVRLKTGVGGDNVGYSHQCGPHQQSEDGRKNFSKNAQIKATKHVVKMLVAVVVAFFICWAPFHAQRLLAVYADEKSASMIILYQTLTYSSGILYYLSTTVNPVLYHIMSHKFREAFKDTLARYLGRRRARGGRWQCYTVLSGRSSRHSNTSNPVSNASNCGTTTGSLRRCMEADMARLHASRRPIVVSFRRHYTQQQTDSGATSMADSELSGCSTSTGPEVYVSLEELTKNNCRFNSRKISKLRKTRNKLNRTYLSVIFRHSKSTIINSRDNTAKEGSDNKENCSNFVSSSNSPFPFDLNHDNQSEDVVPSLNEELGTIPPNDINFRVQTPQDYADVTRSTGNTTSNVVQYSETVSSNYPKVEDIEIFQEQHLKIQSSFKKRHRNTRHNRHHHKMHKPPTASLNGIEHDFRGSRDESYDSLNGTKNYIKQVKCLSRNETSHYSVPRSSTLPSFQSVAKDSHFIDNRDVQAMDLSVQSLKCPHSFQTNFDTHNRNLLAEGRSKCELSFELVGLSCKMCVDSYSLDSNISFKSEPFKICHKQERRNFYDIIQSPTTKIYTTQNKIPNDSCNNNQNSLSRLEPEDGNLLTHDEIHHERETILRFSPPTLLAEKKGFVDGANGYIQAKKIKEKTKFSKHQRSLSSDNETKYRRNMNGINVGVRDIEHETNASLEIDRRTDAGKTYNISDPKYISNKRTHEFTVSVPYCNTRRKSCTDLSLPTQVSVKQSCDLFPTTAHSSSQIIALCNPVL